MMLHRGFDTMLHRIGTLHSSILHATVYGKQTPWLRRSDITFITLSTLLLAGVGTLVKSGRINWIKQGGASLLPSKVRILWFTTAFLCTVPPPIVVLFTLRKHESVRLVLAPYLMIQAAHVLSDIAFARIFFYNMFVLDGTMYTIYRIWQSWQLSHVFARHSEPTGLARRTVQTVLLMGLLVWIPNLVLLFLSGWRKIVDFS